MSFEPYKNNTNSRELNYQFLQKNTKLFKALEKLLKELNMSDDFRIKTMEKVIRRVVLGE